jgi:hypothetical protein
MFGFAEASAVLAIIERNNTNEGLGSRPAAQ